MAFAVAAHCAFWAPNKLGQKLAPTRRSETGRFVVIHFQHFSSRFAKFLKRPSFSQSRTILPLFLFVSVLVCAACQDRARGNPDKAGDTIAPMSHPAQARSETETMERLRVRLEIRACNSEESLRAVLEQSTAVTLKGPHQGCTMLHPGQVIFRLARRPAQVSTVEGIALEPAKLPSGEVIWSDELNDDVKVFSAHRWNQ